ncbi:MAG: hypothetical protein ACYTEQ_01590 [Planctomycetota bacterium]
MDKKCPWFMVVAHPAVDRVSVCCGVNVYGKNIPPFLNDRSPMCEGCEPNATVVDHEFNY